MTDEPPRDAEPSHSTPAGVGLTDRTIGPYRIREEIGRGSMGVIYRARHEKLRHDVAIKLLPPHTLAQIKRTKNSQQQPYLSSRQHQWARST